MCGSSRWASRTTRSSSKALAPHPTAASTARVGAKLRASEEQFVRAVADVLSASHVGRPVPKVILVANDIDITDVNQVV